MRHFRPRRHGLFEYVEEAALWLVAMSVVILVIKHLLGR
jgi:hypothetical protein